MAEVYVEGLDKLLRKLDEIARVEAVQEGLKNACYIVWASAQDKCPVDDGTLRRSITRSIEYDKGIVGTNTEYASYVEYGTGLFSEFRSGRKDVPWQYEDAEGNKRITRGQRPQPYLRPALVENKDKIVECICRSIKNKAREVF